MQQPPVTRCRKSEEGYILVTLTLFVALLVIAAAAIAPTFAFQIRRDREEELIHRGVQYSRAVEKYFKKFGRYPTTLKDLENTNNLRFLRRRYKDPLTGRDFRLLHYSEVQMMGGGAGIPGATPASAMASPGMAGSSPSGSQGFSLGSGGSQGSFGQAQGTPGGTPPQPGSSTDSASDSNAANSTSSSSSTSSTPVVGGPIVGVISTDKEKSIREFGGKDHYNQWQFIYDPGTAPRAGLINTPAQPPLQNATATGLPGQTTPGQPGIQTPGGTASGFGASSFGSSSFGSSTNNSGSQQQPAQSQQQPSPPNQQQQN